MSLIINPYSFAGGFTTGLLDTYSGAVGAYSVRQLDKDYTGKCLRVRRSNDNTESDIGFDSNGNFDESALTTFVGANSGYVTTWYDQSGNGNNATQTTTAKQPTIVTSGTVEKLNGKPAVKFPPSGYFLDVTQFADDFSGEDIPLSLFYVFASYSNSGGDKVLGFGLEDSQYPGSHSYRYPLVLEKPNFNIRTILVDDSENGNAGYGSLGLTVNVQYIFSYTSNGININIFRNGASTAEWSGSLDFGYITYDRATLQSLNEGGNQLSQEILIYASDKSSDRTGIRDNINSYFGVY